ncbi:MAG: TolC family protein [Phycisphaerae bacterium]
MRSATALWLSVTLMVTAGCQTYQPAPLDLTGYDATWRGRDLAAAPVAEYARQLAQSATPAERFDPSDGLTAREGEVVALLFNPRLRVARAKARVSAVGAAEAGRWEDPELSIDAERIIESVQSPWVLGGTLSLTLPLSGRLEAERAKASAEARAQLAGVLVEEAAVVAELYDRWLELAVLDHRITLARQYLADLGAVADTAERLRARGELDPVDAKLFRVEQVRRRAELRGFELDRPGIEAAVKAVMGLTPTADVRLVPSLPPVVNSGESAVIRQRVADGHPKILQSRAEYETAERALALEIRKQFPDLKVGGGYGIDEGTHRLLGGLSIPIPLFNTNRKAIAEARASRDAACAAAEAAHEEVLGGLARAEISLSAARERRRLFETELVPLVDEHLRDVRKLGRIGDANTVVLLESLTRAFEAKVELLAAVEKEAKAANQVNAALRPVTRAQPMITPPGAPHP